MHTAAVPTIKTHRPIGEIGTVTLAPATLALTNGTAIIAVPPSSAVAKQGLNISRETEQFTKGIYINKRNHLLGWFAPTQRYLISER